MTLPIYRGWEQHGKGWEAGDKGTGNGRAGYGRREVLTPLPPPPPPLWPSLKFELLRDLTSEKNGAITALIVSITKFLIAIGFPCAYLSCNRRDHVGGQLQVSNLNCL